MPPRKMHRGTGKPCLSQTAKDGTGWVEEDIGMPSAVANHSCFTAQAGPTESAKLQSQTPVLPNATDETSTHRPLLPQTRRPLIVLYRLRQDVHSSSSTAADETPTHPLPLQTRRPLIVLYCHRRDVHSSSSKALCETNTNKQTQ
ncbi:hypothetical protein HF521_016942 [Silurus meridionalis]|uniref:Uncharacterized protein n=1 Tax=Silurus meridionalis TaxID=175797 RepID=A0A8T0BLT0_SILME|nr:hypothetical protein HF521_016942 [Silurus meridionalis]